MHDERDVNKDLFTRRSFAILVFKIILLQIFLGCAYFTFLSALELINVGLTLSRISVFVIYQVLETVGALIIFLRWFYLCYDINETEIVCYKGIIAKNVEYYSLENVESVKVKQGIIGAICKFGTLYITIHHNDYRDVVCIKNISRPRRHIKTIEKSLVDFQKQKMTPTP